MKQTTRKKITNLKTELRFTSLTIGAFFITSIVLLMLAFTSKVSKLFVNTNIVSTNNAQSVHVAISHVELCAANPFYKSANNFYFIKPTNSVAFNNHISLPNKISTVGFTTVFCSLVPTNISTI